MNIDKTLKIVWILCGGTLLTIMLAGSFFALDLDNYFNLEEDGEIGVAIDNSRNENLHNIKLELSTGGPIKLTNSENYIMPVYISYEERSQALRADFGSYDDKDLNVNEPSNIIFLNKDFDTTRILLNKKALIKKMDYPISEDDNDLSSVQEAMPYITYEIIFNDTNKNGQLDEHDHSDLFISDLHGNHLKQITNDLPIKRTEYLDRYKTILIHVGEEEKETGTSFYKYSITDDRLYNLQSIHESLKKIENILTK